MTGPTIGPIHPRVADRFDGYEIPDLPAPIAQRAVDAAVALFRKWPPEDIALFKEKIGEHDDEFIHHLSEFGEHHGWGMWFRNWLRHSEDGGPGITDADLHDGEYANWDDYYCEIVCEAIKQIEVPSS
jgi:hypothetical protein